MPDSRTMRGMSGKARESAFLFARDAVAIAPRPAMLVDLRNSEAYQLPLVSIKGWSRPCALCDKGRNTGKIPIKTIKTI